VNRHSLPTIECETRQRLRLDVTGAVQGVGFRPFIHRLAMSEGLGGFVCNTGAGVLLEVEGGAQALDRFLARLDAEITPPARIHERQASWVPVQGELDFVISPSVPSGRRSAVVLPDLATCSDCLKEIFDPDDRRYRYPFATCVHCGPRYSIVEAVPYDRARTTMRHFPMCTACQAEYDDPGSCRFHVEANACPDCGPQIVLWDAAGNALASSHHALKGAADALRQGRIVALKGLGGFQLLVDARNDAAVRRLRDRKRRPAKPFALMVRTFADALAITNICAEEKQLLCSAAAPIVLLRARSDSALVAPSVAPSNPLLGVMLPSTPLHHLLMDALGFPIVATSGNRGGEPIVADENEALERLKGLADIFLVHDRPILRPVDDSVARVLAGREVMLRSARGYAPLSLADPFATAPGLAVGGHQKNAVAVAFGGQIILGPHIGDLDEAETRAAFTRAVEALPALHDVHPEVVACDEHPDYYSTRFANDRGPKVRRLPHHLAHVLAGMVDNGLDGPVLGVAWDGTGYGGDGTIWGGEFLAVEGSRYRRAAHLMPFRLPGGEAAVREPRRAALGALYATFGDGAFAMTDIHPVAAFAPAERQLLARMLARGVNSPLTSSAGRLFDAVAAILGFRQKVSFEGEAAMAVEFAADRAANIASLAPPTISNETAPIVIDWRPMLAAMMSASREGVPAEDLAAAFHDGLAATIVTVAKRVGMPRVLLTGGCFQNGRLTEQAVARLREAGLDSYWHHRIPPNDGGLAVGQAAFTARPLIEEMA
jgi:hydrogenase maturation protein HypF